MQLSFARAVDCHRPKSSPLRLRHVTTRASSLPFEGKDVRLRHDTTSVAAPTVSREAPNGVRHVRATRSDLTRFLAKVAAGGHSEVEVAAQKAVKVFHGLKGDDFRHPLDQQNTRLLKTIPGLETIAKSMLGPVAEQVLLLENISTSVKVGPHQLPSVHQLLVEAAEILQMECPEVYVRQNAVPNAYTLAISGRKPFIVVHTSLLELLTSKEVQVALPFI